MYRFYFVIISICVLLKVQTDNKTKYTLPANAGIIILYNGKKQLIRYSLTVHYRSQNDQRVTHIFGGGISTS
jgi:hypothetical protein